MKSKNFLNLLMNKNIIIPNYLIKYYKDLSLNEKELIFLSYIISYKDKIVFDIETYSEDLNMDINDLMIIIESLSNKGLITMVVLKNMEGKMQEYLKFDALYDKIMSFILDYEEEKIESNIYEVIEREFGRTLSPIEYETIKRWLDSNIDESLIKEALKEAVLNGVNNLKYIDKILYEWIRKGYKKNNDIKKEVKEEVVELFDYDWLDDEEDK